MGFINMIRKTRISRDNEYLSHRRSGVVEWDSMGRKNPFLIHEFDTGVAFGVPAEEYDGRYNRVDGTRSSFYQV